MKRLLRVLPGFLLGMVWHLAGVAADTPAPRIASAEIDGYQLALRFSEPMLTWSGTSKDAGITIEPPLDCDWGWSDDTELSCSLPYDVAPRPATTYCVALRGGLWSQQEREAAAQEITVDYLVPEVEAGIADWKDDVPELDVSTNAPVREQALRAVLRLTQDDRDVPFRLEANDDPGAIAGRKWRLVFHPLDAKPASLVLRAQPGLRAIEGNLAGTQDAVLLKASVNESFRLRLVACRGSDPRGDVRVSRADDGKPLQLDCPAGEAIGLEFSNAPSAETIAWLQAHLPRGLRWQKEPVPFYYGRPESEHRRPGHFIGLVAEQARESWKLDLPESFVSASGAALTATQIKLRAGDFRPAFNLAAARLLLPPGGDVPALLELINQPSQVLQQRELGGAGIETDEAKLAAPSRNVLSRRAPPSAGRDVRKHGGLVYGSVMARAATEFYPSYGVAYAAFDITASRAGDQLLVWVTDWDRAAAITDAQVEVLRVDGTAVSVLTTAATDSDGVAIIDSKDLSQMAQKEGTLMIRATQAQRRAIVPLSGELSRHHIGENGERYGALGEAETLLWGVSDKPLYRPGETVRYRLWRRERRQNHLRLSDASAEQKLALKSQYGDTPVSEYTVQLDAFGSAAGEIRLPTTLRDDDYCLGQESHYETHGVCFRVSGYHANELWAELKAGRSLAREGDTLTLDASGGYYSGGAAAGARAEFQSLLTPLRLEEAYPQFRGFTFVDPYADTPGAGGESFGATMARFAQLDAQGHARAEVRLLPRPAEAYGDEKPIPFGTLEFTVAVSTSASSVANSAPAALKFSRHARFVGLKVEPWLLRADTDPELDAVVIAADGSRVPDAVVALDVSEVVAEHGTHGEPVEKADKVLVHCEWKTGTKAACPFRAEHSGRYHFRARSEGALETVVDRYVYAGSTRPEPVASDGASLEAGENSVAVGTEVELVLRQPFTQAQVLLAIEHGAVLKHWIEHVEGPMARIKVPMERGWAPGVTVTAVVLDASEDAFGPQARAGKLVEVASTDIALTGGASAVPLELSMPANAKPGEEVSIRLRNPGAARVQATLALVDDAVRELVPELATATDPRGKEWLGQLSDWDNSSWYGLGDWSRGLLGARNFSAGSWAMPVDVGSSEKLETIVVTGSRITAAEVFVRRVEVEHVLTRSSPTAGAVTAALRSRFADTALWQTDLLLDPGSERTVRVRLPDNLTRWRALAWSADEGEGFALAQATVQASLPIEVRTETPVRLVPGDRATIAASVRNHANAPRELNATLQASGAGVQALTQWTRAIAAEAQQPILLQAQPTTPGTVDVGAQARSAASADGVAARIEVASPILPQRLPLAGWLTAEGVKLKLPSLPPGASHARLRVKAGRGVSVVARGWVEALRDYPHRCWEQMLSRAVGAASARRLGLAQSWPEDDTVVDDVLRSAGQFQDDGGRFHFFAGQYATETTAPSVYLTAYTVQAFAFLKALGYAVPQEVDREARKALSSALEAVKAESRGNPEDLALAASMTEAKVPASALDWLWNARKQMSWFGHAQLARALASSPARAEQARQLLDELRQAGAVRGSSRVIETRSASAWALSSPQLEQCGVLDALWRLDSGGTHDERLALLRGLLDLYAGGGTALDTQANAQCLMALVQLPESAASDQPVQVRLSAEGIDASIVLGAHEPVGEWLGEYGGLPATVGLSTSAAKDMPLSFVANVEFERDVRHAEAMAVGFALERRYSVLRDKAWKDVPAASIRAGDWVRVGLHLTTARPRRFVAITDSVAGGLRPTDLQLAGVAGLELRDLGANGSPYFSERQVDDRQARFYAEQLPPGSHQIYYYTRAAYAGHYAALPAMAELMYGAATIARSAAASLDIAPP